MELLHTLTFSSPYLHLHRFLPKTRTPFSFIKPTHTPSHSYPRLSTRASLSTSPSLLTRPPEVPVPSNTRWIVVTEKPPVTGASKSDIVDYYVKSLARVVGCEREAQMCIYDASCESNFGFCCDIDEGLSLELSRIPGIVSVRPDNTPVDGKKDYSHPSLSLAGHSKMDRFTPKFSPLGKEYEYWIVRMEKPGVEMITKAQMVDYYAQILEKVLRNKQDAQVSIYHISWQNELGFCCRIDEECAKELSDVPGVLSVRPDLSFESENKNYEGIPGIVSVRPDNTPAAGKDYSHPTLSLADNSKLDILTPKFSPLGKDYEYWIVRMQKPEVETVTKAQMVDYYAQILEKVLRNKQDAQVSIYHISWQSELGFCCRIDEECAKELSDVPGVLSVRPDLSFESENKNYKGSFGPLESNGTHDSSEASLPDVKTKRLFVTGLSFYTSEKTLRAAFEGFGELVEVKVIMDKISKRSKGYAFIEYTTEAAAGAALKEMNGKIINGWMIIVDVARTNASGSFRIKEKNHTSTAPLNQVNRLG